MGRKVLMNEKKCGRFIGCNKISHENISGKRAASEGAGLNVSGPAKGGKGGLKGKGREGGSTGGEGD